MLTPLQRRVLLYLADDEIRTPAQIAHVLQIAPAECQTTLAALERQDLLFCCVRLVGGKPVQ